MVLAARNEAPQPAYHGGLERLEQVLPHKGAKLDERPRLRTQGATTPTPQCGGDSAPG